MKQFMGLLLMLVTVVSAVGVVYAKHKSRKLFVELQQLEGQRDNMNIEWGQLQLEQSTLTTHGQVERIARDRMNMHIPEPQSVVILRQ